MKLNNDNGSLFWMRSALTVCKFCVRWLIHHYLHTTELILPSILKPWDLFVQFMGLNALHIHYYHWFSLKLLISKNFSFKSFISFLCIGPVLVPLIKWFYLCISAGICGLYERKLKDINPTIRNINYDISDLYNFIDGLADMSALV